MPVVPGDESLNKSISLCNQIHLNYQQNIVSFEFAALDYTSPASNQYRYMLEGIDPEWVFSDASRRFITYTNLDPGEYNFRVKGSNNDGVWNEQGVSLAILITPPWWQTWWFRISGFLALIGFVLLVINNRLAHLRQVNIAQKEFSRKLIASQEEERKRIASALHDSHGQNLLIISNELQQFIHENRGFESRLKPVSATVQEAINEIRDISYDLHPSQLDRLGLIRAIESMVNRIKRTTDIQISCFIADIEDVFDKKVAINIFRIIQEALNNIVKHSAASSGQVIIEKKYKLVVISILDNGQGFDQNQLSSEANGLGLASMAERVNMLNGDFKIESRPGDGTKISIRLPLPEIK